MNILIFFATLIIFGIKSVTLEEVSCPEVDGPIATLLPNPIDCNSFLQCIDGTGYVMPCPVGLHWNNILKVSLRCTVNRIIELKICVF